MTANDDITNQHDIVIPSQNSQLPPDDEDQNQIDGGEINSDLDELHRGTFGDTDNLPLDKEVNKDEIKIVKDLTKNQQKSK